jgi:hypothetical protein
LTPWKPTDDRLPITAQHPASPPTRLLAMASPLRPELAPAMLLPDVREGNPNADVDRARPTRGDEA